jgi:hypothetical protein
MQKVCILHYEFLAYNLKFKEKRDQEGQGIAGSSERK